MAPPRPFIDPRQHLPRLTVKQRLIQSGLLPGRLTLDPWVEDTRRHRRANIVLGTAQTFPSVFLDEIEKKFHPVRLAGGRGCMQACYGVLAILYTEMVSKELHVEVFKRAKDKANAIAKANPKKLKAQMEELQATKPMLTDEDAKQQVIDKWISNNNTSDHLYRLMGERGMAEEKVNSHNTKAEQAIRSLTGDLPGLYFFGMAVRDNHTVTLAVERAADGSQRMYWLDQNQPGLSKEIKAGQLGTELQGVPGHTESTNIYPFRAPTAGGA